MAGRGIGVSKAVKQGSIISLDSSILGSGVGPGTIRVLVEDASAYMPGDGVDEVDDVTILSFDIDNFEIYDAGSGKCVIKLKTCPATCP